MFLQCGSTEKGVGGCTKKCTPGGALKFMHSSPTRPTSTCSSLVMFESSAVTTRVSIATALADTVGTTAFGLQVQMHCNLISPFEPGS